MPAGDAVVAQRDIGPLARAVIAEQSAPATSQAAAMPTAQLPAVLTTGTAPPPPGEPLWVTPGISEMKS